MVDQGEINVTEKTDYLDRILGQVKNYSERMERRAEEGLGMIRNELLNSRNKQVEELSSKLDEMARIIREIQKK
jgi:polyhydroxyalkanoate synthesis regulator phasin